MQLHVQSLHCMSKLHMHVYAVHRFYRAFTTWSHSLCERVFFLIPSSATLLTFEYERVLKFAQFCNASFSSPRRWLKAKLPYSHAGRYWYKYAVTVQVEHHISGWSDVSWNNAEVTRVTPFLHSLKEEGLLLDKHYSHQSCSPSRSAFMTGYDSSHTNLPM